MSREVSEELFKRLTHFLQDKYTISKENKGEDIYVKVSDLTNRANITIYHTGKLSIGGKQSKVKEKLEYFKENIESIDFSEKSIHTTFDILTDQLREEIKHSFSEIDGNIKNIEDKMTMYTIKLIRGSSSVTIRQFKNGTLTLQGKENFLYENVRDKIIQVSNPTEKEVMTSFISDNEEKINEIAERYSPELGEKAKNTLISKVDKVYNFLEEYDKKYAICSECFLISRIELPEYSAYVMPAAKCFEGFCKKILVAVGFFEENHWDKKGSNFSRLNNLTDPRRIDFCKEKRFNDHFLKRIDNSKDRYRNFTLHSDDHHITKVDSYKHAEDLINDIFKELKEIFDYFNGEYKLLS